MAGRIAASAIPVQWTAVEDGSGIRGYDLEVSADGDANWTRLLTETQATTYTFTGTLGVAYTVRVRATDNVSNVSAWVQAVAKTVVVKKYYTVPSAGSGQAAGQRVAMRSNGVLYYLHSDHLGSTSLTTNGTGVVVAEQKYLPYGEVRWVTGTLPTDFTYTGQRSDAYTQLAEMGARWYSPRLGRWISPDPIIPGFANSQSLNRYMYVFGQVLKLIDPNGYTPQLTRDHNDSYTFGQVTDTLIKNIVEELAGYGIAVESQADWTLPELMLTRNAATDLIGTMGEGNFEIGQRRFRSQVGSISIYRVRGKDRMFEFYEKRGGPPKAVALFNRITFYDGTFRYDVLENKATIVHEIAHCWDFHTLGHASSWLDNSVGKERMPSRYADDNRASTEHWAETVASWTYPEYAKREGYWLGPRHQSYVEAVSKGRLPLLVMVHVLFGAP